MTLHNGFLSSYGALAVAALLSVTTPTFAQTPSSPPPDPQAITSTPSSQPDETFLDMLDDTLGDFGRLPSRTTFTWLGLGAALALAAHAADDATSSSLAGSGTLDGVFEAGETMGTAGFQLAGAATSYVVGRVTDSRKVLEVGAELLRAQILTQAITGAIKVVARRDRPDGTRFSFPSGHASVTFASATVLHRHLGWKVGGPAYGVAAYVATSRIQEKRHFLSDVVFGAAVGIVAGRTVTIGRGGAAIAITPTATPAGAALTVTWD